MRETIAAAVKEPAAEGRSMVSRGLLLSSARRELLNQWFWLGAGIAILLVLPNLLWEMYRGWPTMALLRTVIGTKYYSVGPWDYVWQQSLLTHPFCTPIWLAGLWFFFADPCGKMYRVLNWAYLVVLAEMLVLHGKTYYMAPAYVMLLAAGCVWIEKQAWLGMRRWRRPAIVMTLFAGGAKLLTKANSCSIYTCVSMFLGGTNSRIV